MSNLLKDYLPDAPREASVLVAAAEAGLASMIQDHLRQGLDPGTAARLAAGSFADRTALTPDACNWAVSELTVALDRSTQRTPQPGGGPATGAGWADGATAPPATGASGPRGAAAPQTAAPGAPETMTAGAAAWAPDVGAPAGPGQEPAAGRRSSRTRNWLVAGGAAAVVIAVVVFLVVVKPATNAHAHTGVIGQATSVPVSALNAVGAGSTYSRAVSQISGTPLTVQGKPELLYIGATFCPFCGANQWGMIVALSRFGTFAGLRPSRSAPSPEAYPDTATLTFYKSSFSSKYLVFISVENETVTRTPLQPTTAQEQALWQRYDPDSYPFLDIGNAYKATSLFDPQVLHGKSQKEIAAALSHPSSPIAKAVDGSANLITAAICKVTNGQPGSVCNSPTISTIQGGL